MAKIFELFSNGKDRTALCFDKATLKQDKDGNKSAKMRFAVRLEPDAVRASPPWIQAEFGLKVPKWAGHAQKSIQSFDFNDAAEVRRG